MSTTQNSELTPTAQTGTPRETPQSQLNLFEDKAIDAAWDNTLRSSQNSWGTPEFQREFARAVIEEYKKAFPPPPPCPPMPQLPHFLYSETALVNWIAGNLQVLITRAECGNGRISIVGSPIFKGKYGLSSSISIQLPT